MSTAVEVDLDAIRQNFGVLDRCSGTAEVWPVIKADAYGHGLLPVARTLESAGAKSLCVDRVEEAITLRDAGVHVPVLLMGAYDVQDCADIAARGIIPVLSNASTLEALARAASNNGTTVRAHLKIDTGMGRLGIRLADLDELARRAAKHSEIRITGLMTHFACADADDPSFTTEQIARFEQASAQLARAGLVGATRVRHAANSAATLNGIGLYDVVRPGLAIYGISPTGAARDELRPAMAIRSQVIALRTIGTGESVGYGATFRARRETRIATIALGYADGLSRHLSNRGSLLVRGRRAPIVGIVSMGMSAIDVTDIEGVREGDPVVVLGTQLGPLGQARITAQDLARDGDTIPWDVLTSVSAHLRRSYRPARSSFAPTE